MEETVTGAPAKLTRARSQGGDIFHQHLLEALLIKLRVKLALSVLKQWAILARQVTLLLRQAGGCPLEHGLTTFLDVFQDTVEHTLVYC